MRGAGATLAAVAAGAVLAACGGGIILQDDLAVERTGSGPGARLNLVINDSGTVMCNGHKAVPITDPQLILARYLSMALADDAQEGLSLKPRAAAGVPLRGAHAGRAGELQRRFAARAVAVLAGRAAGAADLPGRLQAGALRILWRASVREGSCDWFRHTELIT